MPEDRPLAFSQAGTNMNTEEIYRAIASLYDDRNRLDRVVEALALYLVLLCYKLSAQQKGQQGSRPSR